MNRKAIVTMSIGIITLLVLVIGATYAYFIVGTSGSTNATLNISTPQIGTVSITGGSNLTLNVTADMMMNKGEDVIYYASPSGATTNKQSYPVATAKVTGPGTYDCDYTINIKGTGDLYEAVQKLNNKNHNAGLQMFYDGISLSRYDFDDSSNTGPIFTESGLTYSGKLSGLTQTSPKSVLAVMYISNYLGTDQSFLANKTVSITFKITSFSCKAV